MDRKNSAKMFNILLKAKMGLCETINPKRPQILVDFTPAHRIFSHVSVGVLMRMTERELSESLCWL